MATENAKRPAGKAGRSNEAGICSTSPNYSKSPTIGGALCR